MHAGLLLSVYSLTFVSGPLPGGEKWLEWDFEWLVVCGWESEGLVVGGGEGRGGEEGGEEE